MIIDKNKFSKQHALWDMRAAAEHQAVTQSLIGLQKTIMEEVQSQDAFVEIISQAINERYVPQPPRPDQLKLVMEKLETSLKQLSKFEG